MADADVTLFESERARTALEKYGAVTDLTIRVYEADHRPCGEPVHPTPLFQLFASGGRDAAEFLDSLCPTPRRSRSPTVVEEYGLATVATTLRLDGAVVSTAVAGPALVRHLTHRDMQQIARRSGLPYDAVWSAARKQLPVPRGRLETYGELLQVVGETILSDSARARRLEDALSRLEATDRAKDLFLATLSHELRTPLTSIVGWVRMLRSGLDSEASLRALDVIDRNAKLQVRLINDLLDVSRAIAGKVDLDIRPVPLVPVVEAAFHAARPAADAKQVRLDVVLDGSVGLVTGDRDRLGQIVSNLLSNAVKFTPAGGRVDVALRRIGARAEFRVSDTGPGIGAEFLPRLFERFQQADAGPARSHGGLGLGLALVKHFTELHHGTVRAESAGEGQGATFTVTLPLLDVVQEAVARPPSAASEPETPRLLQRARILLVEDDADTRDLLTIILQTHGADVTAVASAAEALKVFDRLPPDLIVSDIGLPGVDGCDLMRRIRAREAGRGKRTPALAVTALSEMRERSRTLRAGYQRHLTKPVEGATLARVAAELLGRDSA